jgi:hypothetical protein
MPIWTIVMVLAIIIFVILPGLKPRTMPVKKLLILPVVFLYLFYSSLTAHFPLNLDSYLLIGLAAVLGIVIGALLRRNTQIQADYQNHRISLPGSYMGLINFLLIFAVHFVIGYQLAVKPQVFTSVNPEVQVLVFALSLVSCMSIGMNACLYYKYKTAASR